MKAKISVQRKLDRSDIATILAALRSFQKQYEDRSAKEIRQDWPNHFRTNSGKAIQPLSTPDIDILCAEINNGSVRL